LALKEKVASAPLVQQNIRLRQEGKPMLRGFSNGKSERLIVNMQTLGVDGNVNPFVRCFDALITEECAQNSHAREMFSKLTGGTMIARVEGVQEVMGIACDRFGTRETFISRQRRHRDTNQPKQQILWSS